MHVCSPVGMDVVRYPFLSNVPRPTVYGGTEDKAENCIMGLFDLDEWMRVRVHRTLRIGGPRSQTPGSV